jgi:alkylation response protein AidB-like acyl-CoA dehydrogenase
MDLAEGPAAAEFRAGVRGFLGDALSGRFAAIRGRGGPGDEQALVDGRLEWERYLAEHRWNCTGWPAAHGGRGLNLAEQVIFHEEYARASGPGRLGHIGETLLAPTIIAFGTPAQQLAFLPPIRAAEVLWCQGYSEPGAGSDLAAVSTKAVLDGSEWVISGQKVWTSLAQWSEWGIVLARTEAGSQGHAGLSYLLVPMRQPGIEIRPIRQMTGGSEFNEVFFDGARTAADHVVGAVGEGWRVAMGTLAFERGVSTLGQVLQFSNELDEIVAVAERSGRGDDPVVRQRIAAAWSRLSIMRWNSLRILAGEDPPAGGEGVSLAGARMITKLYWASLHRDLGELGIDVLGLEGVSGSSHDDGTAERLARLFLFSRADTIYAGTNEIQRNLIGERALALPKEPR